MENKPNEQTETTAVKSEKAVAKSAPAKKTKSVRNRSGFKVELLINGEVVTFLPGKIVEVPFEFEIPNGIGLYVK